MSLALINYLEALINDRSSWGSCTRIEAAQSLLDQLGCTDESLGLYLAYLDSIPERFRAKAERLKPQEKFTDQSSEYYRQVIAGESQ
tara:strand:- start:1450 stop:1710 length:261 start_codon:yes stop_codon:yes gene_type:complete